MNNETLEYIARRMERGREYTDRPDYESGSISRRYSPSGNYRMDNPKQSESKDDKKERKIGFAGEEKHHKNKDILYQMEETLEITIGDIICFSELAMDAERLDCAEDANIFYELAKDKIKCAEMIRLRLIKEGTYNMSGEIEDAYDRAKHLFKRL